MFLRSWVTKMNTPWRRTVVSLVEPALVPSLGVYHYNILADHYCKMSDFYGVRIAVLCLAYKQARF